MAYSIRNRFTRGIRVIVALAFLLGAFAVSGGHALAKGEPDNGGSGVVYTLTNAAAGNAVAIYTRAGNGTLTAAGTVSTGGLGTGAGLGSQGSLAFSDNGRWLFAVNAGSNDISVLDASGHNLALVDREPSGGVRPISVTSRGDIVYVLNAGVPNNISGFRIGSHGSLHAIPGSTRPLSGADVSPAQIEFSDNGRSLVVTEKGTNKIDTYRVGLVGYATGPNIQNAAGMTPFGFEFDGRGHLIVSEAFGGATNASAASSYSVNFAGVLNTISASAATHQTAACWVAVSKDGKYAYTTNAGSGSVTGFRVAHDGSLSLLNADGRTGVVGDGSSPTDASVNGNGHYLYVLASASHQIVGFSIGNNGSLTPIGNVSGLIPGTVGLVSR